MPSTIVVAVPEGEEPNVSSALRMLAAAAQEEQNKQNESPPYPEITAAADVATDDVAAAASLSSIKRKIEEASGGGTYEPLPKSKKYKKIKHGAHYDDDAQVPVGEEGATNNNTTWGQPKRGINVCLAEGCKNEPVNGWDVCLVHGAKMSLHGSGGREITPVKEDDESGGSATSSSSSDDAATPSSDNTYDGTTEWPLTDILAPGKNDCLFGRGGGTNHHPGNKKYRKLVDCKKVVYLASRRLDKPIVAMQLIQIWRAMSPPGRFLVQDKKTELWNDVGDVKAREKTSQALREKTPAPKKVKVKRG